MLKRYQRWMHDWEYRLTTRDTNRVVRPLDYRLEWTRRWPQAQDVEAVCAVAGDGALKRDGAPHLPEFGRCGTSIVSPDDANGIPHAEHVLRALNERVVADSDRFFAYEPRSDYRLEEDGQFLRFTSAVDTPFRATTG